MSKLTIRWKEGSKEATTFYISEKKFEMSLNRTAKQTLEINGFMSDLLVLDTSHVVKQVRSLFVCDYRYLQILVC